MNTRELGAEAEEAARDFLTKQGLKLLAQNYYAGHCELDLVMLEGETVVFVEVKSQQSRGGVPAIENMTRSKVIRLFYAINNYIRRRRVKKWRFDVVTVQRNGQEFACQWLKNFDVHY